MKENTVRKIEHTPQQAAPQDAGNGYVNADACRNLIESGQVSQAEFARWLDVSPAKLSGYYKKRYNEVKVETRRVFDRQVGEALARWTRRNLKKIKLADLYIATGHAKKLEGYLDFCADRNQVRIMRGGTGLGKSHVFRQYQARHGNVYIHVCCGSHGYGKLFLADLYYAVMQEDLPDGTTYGQADRAITKKLQKEDALLIFDDAHKLSTRTLEKIMELFDACPMLGIAIGDQSDAQDAPGYNRSIDFARNPQILSRIGGEAWSLDAEIRREDVALFCAHFGINAEGVITWLANVVNLPETRYRWLAEIVAEAVNISAAKDRPELLSDPAVFELVHRKIRRGE